MRRSLSIIIAIAIVTIVAAALSGCSRQEQKLNPGRLQVVTTLFPLYDFARTIAGDAAEVTMLLPPGAEPHSFEPKPNDIVRIGRAALFIYTNPDMEPWAGRVLKGIDNRNLRVVNAGEGISYYGADPASGREQGHEHEGAHGGRDPHVWLDFGNAAIMVDNLLAGFVAADPAHADRYRINAEALKGRLADLDRRFRIGLQECGTRTLLHGGHFTFGYLARRYGLEYRSLSGVSSESEPSAARMAAMVREIKGSGVRYLFAEELLSPRLSETLAGEAGVTVLKLHGAHNLGRDEFQRGATFIGLMEQNLAALEKGLACRTK